MKNTKILGSTFVITLVFSLVLLSASQPSASACRIRFGWQPKRIDMELSPPSRLFHTSEDGCFYPGSPKITKKLDVFNVGDVPFRICRFNATFTGDTELAAGLQIEILELSRGRNAQAHLLYNGTLSNLSEGVEVTGKRAVAQRKSVTLQLTAWMPETAGNEYQGLATTADIAVTVCFPPANNGENI